MSAYTHIYSARDCYQLAITASHRNTTQSGKHPKPTQNIGEMTRTNPNSVYVTTCIVSFGEADDVLCDAGSLRPLVQGKPGLVGVVRQFEIREQFLMKP